MKFKAVKLLITFCCLSLFSLLAVAKHHNKNHHGKMVVKPIVVTKNQKEITVTLKANKTTGYSWFLVSYDHELLEPEKSTYIPPTSQLVGAPGKMTFTFEVDDDAFTVPRMSHISLIYARPWDMKDASIRVIPVIFQ